MHFIKNVSRKDVLRRLGVLQRQAWPFAEKVLLYSTIFATPLMVYWLEIEGKSFEIHKIREIAFYSFSIILCSFLQNSRWLRCFVVWCVINWWLGYFWPVKSYVVLTHIFSALVIYIGLKYLICKKFLHIDWILRLVCLTSLFQFGWWIMQRFFHYDPLFYGITAAGVLDVCHPVPTASWSGNPSILGVFFACTAFLFLHYFKIKNFPLLFFLLVIPVLFIKNATTMICFIIGGLFYLLNKYRLNLKTCLIGLILILSLSAFFVNVKYPNFDRLPIWKQLITDGVKLHPFKGCGLTFFSELYIIDKTGTPWREAHNDYLQLILELGIIGFILFAGWIISRYVIFFRGKKTHLEICLTSCLTAYLTAGFSLFPMHRAQLSFYAIVFLVCLEIGYGNFKSISAFCA